jgi:hypothetical protein
LGAAVAWRTCKVGPNPMKGVWGESDVEACISPFVKKLKDGILQLLPSELPINFKGESYDQADDK